MNNSSDVWDDDRLVREAEGVWDFALRFFLVQRILEAQLVLPADDADWSDVDGIVAIMKRRIEAKKASVS